MNYQHFSVEEREKIQAMLWEKCSVRSIARELGRSPSSVAREIIRNLPPEHRQYTPRLANERALKKRKSRGRHDRLKNQFIRDYVIRHLKKGWSPEQVAGRLSVDHPGQSISHEAIYQYVYAMVRPSSDQVRAQGVDLRPYLKRRHRQRVKKGGRRTWRMMKPDVPRIDTRSAVVERRSRVGDWEGDTIASKHHTPGLNSLVDRKSGLLLLTKLRDGTADATADAVTQRLLSFPNHTLTLDNGTENQQWKRIQYTLSTRCYFAYPYHSWERGSNENTNGLVRWYFPKGTDFRTIPEEAIAAVEYTLNTRPRKRLGWKTPLEVFMQSVALQG